MIWREGTTSQSPDGAVETPTSGVITREDFRRRARARAMQVNAHLAFTAVAQDRRYHATNQLRLGKSHRVRDRDRTDARVRDGFCRFRNFLFAPGLSVRITERHRNVSDHGQV